MRFVDDDRVVSAQLAVPLHLRQQDAVGHHLDQGVCTGVVGEAHLVADRGSELGLELLRDALGNRPGCDPTRLGVADQALDTATEVEADLGQLGGLAGAGLPRHDNNLMVSNGGSYVVPASGDGQVVGIADLRHGGETTRDPGSPGLGRLAPPSVGHSLSRPPTAGPASTWLRGARGLRRALDGHDLQVIRPPLVCGWVQGG